MNCWPSRLRQFLPDQARHHVGRAAGRKRHDDAHEPVRVVVGANARAARTARRTAPRSGRSSSWRSHPWLAVFCLKLRHPARAPEGFIRADKKSRFRSHRAPIAPRFRPTALMTLRRSGLGRPTGRLYASRCHRLDRGSCCRRPLAAAPARPLPARQLDIAPKEVILGWINQYRHHPEPERHAGSRCAA